MNIFETFECSGQKFVNFLMPICKQHVDSSPNFVSLFSFTKDKFYFFSSNNIYFPQKETIKVKIFETFQCSGWNLSNSLYLFWNGNSIPLQILYPYSISWKITPLQFLAQRIYNLLKRSTLKWKFSSLSSARIKICQIPHVNFEMTSQFLFKFCIILHSHDR